MYSKHLPNPVVSRSRTIIELEEDGAGETTVRFLSVAGKGISCISSSS